MRNFVRAWGIVAAAAGSTVLLAGCGGDNGGTTGPNPTRIQVTVLADGDGEAGVTVRLFASGGTTALEEETTNANGQATFDNLDADAYNDLFEVEVEVPADMELSSGSARRAVTVTTGSTATLTFNLVSLTTGGETEVELLGASFSPSSVTITPGTQVVWRNTASITHTVTPDGHSEWTGVTVSQEDETFSHTFNNEGSFPYLCQIHAGMTGTITVDSDG